MISQAFIPNTPQTYPKKRLTGIFGSGLLEQVHNSWIYQVVKENHYEDVFKDINSVMIIFLDSSSNLQKFIKS